MRTRLASVRCKPGRSRTRGSSAPKYILYVFIELTQSVVGDAELVATLLGTTADPQELDAIVSRHDGNPLVESASWSLRTTD